MGKLMASLLVISLAMMAAGTAYGGERAGAITLSPYVGGYTFDGVEKLETRPVVGLRFGYNFVRNFGLEATFGYVPTCFTDYIHGTVNTYNYRLEGVYNFMPESKLVPYVTLGGGGTTLNMPYNTIFLKNNHHSPTVNGGFGVKWFLGENVAFRADYHQNFLLDTDVITYKRHDILANYEYTIGLQILFGGK